jgi:hypothetical protein
MLSLFAATLFVNALLLFWVQPLFGKMVLPLLGGSPSVWTTCMLFFQAALLAGYAYSHAGERWLGIRRQAFAHILLVWLPLFILPIDVNQGGAPTSGHQPIAWLLGVMTTTVGLPFAVLATTAPLLQRWFSACDRSSDPYRLYAASNAGSLVALLAFPVILEPIVPLGSQQTIWTWAYAMVALLLSVCSIVVLRSGSATSPSSMNQVPAADEAPPSASVRLRWLALSFAPSSLMLGVTTYLSTDVAAVPLLWVLPLAIYLLTFIIAFGAYSEPMHRVAARVLPLVLLPLVMILLMQGVLPLSLALPLHLGAFFLLALLCHGELARRRPGIRHLTEFYLWLAIGGVLGGLFNTLLAPQVFTGIVEYPLSLAIAALLCASATEIRELLSRPRALLRPALATALATAVIISGRRGDLPGVQMMAFLGAPLFVTFGARREPARFAIGIIGLFVALATGAIVTPAQAGRLLYEDRTFFGVYRVVADRQQQFVTLAHGTTLHGRQVIGATSPDRSPITIVRVRSARSSRRAAIRRDRSASLVSASARLPPIRYRDRHGRSTRSIRRSSASRVTHGSSITWSTAAAGARWCSATRV